MMNGNVPNYPEHLNPFKPKSGIRSSFRKVLRSFTGKDKERPNNKDLQRYRNTIQSTPPCKLEGNVYDVPEALPRSKFKERLEKTEHLKRISKKPENDVNNKYDAPNPFDDEEYSNPPPLPTSAPPESIPPIPAIRSKRKKKKKRIAPLPPGMTGSDGNFLDVPSRNGSKWSLTSTDTDASSICYSENEEVPYREEEAREILDLTRKIAEFTDDSNNNLTFSSEISINVEDVDSKNKNATSNEIHKNIDDDILNNHGGNQNNHDNRQKKYDDNQNRNDNQNNHHDVIQDANQNIIQKNITQDDIQKNTIHDGDQNKIIQDDVHDHIIQDNIIEENVSQNNIIQDKIIQDKIIQDKIIQDNIIQDNIIQDNTIQNNTIQNNTILNNTIQNNTSQNNTILKTTEDNKIKENIQNNIKDDIKYIDDKDVNDDLKDVNDDLKNKIVQSDLKETENKPKISNGCVKQINQNQNALLHVKIIDNQEVVLRHPCVDDERSETVSIKEKIQHFESYRSTSPPSKVRQTILTKEKLLGTE